MTTLFHGFNLAWTHIQGGLPQCLGLLSSWAPLVTLAEEWRSFPDNIKEICAAHICELYAQPLTYMPCASRSFAVSLCATARSTLTHQDVPELDFALSIRTMLASMKRSEHLKKQNLGWTTNTLVLLELNEPGSGFEMMHVLRRINMNMALLDHHVKSASTTHVMAHALAMLSLDDLSCLEKVFLIDNVMQFVDDLKRLKKANKVHYAQIMAKKSVQELVPFKHTYDNPVWNKCPYSTPQYWRVWISHILLNKMIKGLFFRTFCLESMEILFRTNWKRHSEQDHLTGNINR